jgi:hypothetical protein
MNIISIECKIQQIARSLAPHIIEQDRDALAATIEILSKVRLYSQCVTSLPANPKYLKNLETYLGKFHE